MSYARKKTVWILGAGFSKPLGGPLLYDLLSHKGQRAAKFRFGDKLAQQTAVVYEVFQDGMHKDFKVWEHAEEFLEAVDLAADPSEVEDHRSATSRLLVDMIGARTNDVSIRDFRDRALKAIAAELSFDRWSDPKSEAWSPYLHWGENLTDDDTVITFNYDTVVERLTGRLEELRKTTGLSAEHSILRPGEPLSPWSVTNVLKLHGSLRWGVSTRGSKEHPYTFHGHWDDHLRLGDYEPLIGMPGATKSVYRSQHFDQIWSFATTRIQQAEVIIFFGYRFPPSDAQSRSEILAAIRANKSPGLRIHISLGPNINHEDTVRLHKMLQVVLEGVGRVPVDKAGSGQDWYAILKQPLYVQDFMTILDHDFLNGG